MTPLLTRHTLYLIGTSFLYVFNRDPIVYTRRDEKPKLPTARRRWFVRFASLARDDEPYMSKQDFVESLVEDDVPPLHHRRKTITDDDLKAVAKLTPAVRDRTRSFLGMRTGIISYADYLFLITTLVYPKSVFRILFDVLATPGEDRINLDDFAVIEKIVTKSTERSIPTSLRVHLFGPDGKRSVRYDDFETFLLHLQRDVLEAEFLRASNGTDTITEEDFARVLLRHTALTCDQQKAYLERLRRRLPPDERKGVTFEDFHLYSQFLKTFGDFDAAVRLYQLAGVRVTHEAFQRAAAIATGQPLPEHLVRAVFAVFDAEGEGALSYGEFLVMMRNRLHRTCGPRPLDLRWEGFKACLKRELNRGR